MKATLHNTLLTAVGFAVLLPQSVAAQAQLQNPLRFGTIPDVINAILDIILIFALPIIILMIVFAGFKYVTAQGKPAEIQNANKALTYALIGGAIVLGARVIGSVITATIGGFTV